MNQALVSYDRLDRLSRTRALTMLESQQLKIAMQGLNASRFYLDGLDAARRGRMPSNNPHPLGTVMSREWAKGHRAWEVLS